MMESYIGMSHFKESKHCIKSKNVSNESFLIENILEIRQCFRDISVGLLKWNSLYLFYLMLLLFMC